MFSFLWAGGFEVHKFRSSEAAADSNNKWCPEANLGFACLAAGLETCDSFLSLAQHGATCYFCSMCDCVSSREDNVKNDKFFETGGALGNPETETAC